MQLSFGTQSSLQQWGEDEVGWVECRYIWHSLMFDCLILQVVPRPSSYFTSNQETRSHGWKDGSQSSEETLLLAQVWSGHHIIGRTSQTDKCQWQYCSAHKVYIVFSDNIRILIFSLRSLSSLRLTPSKSSGDGWDIFGVIIDKEILETILGKHYSDPSLKVSIKGNLTRPWDEYSWSRRVDFCWSLLWLWCNIFIKYLALNSENLNQFYPDSQNFPLS